MRKVLSYLRRAVDQYGMLRDGDRVAVGVSGGKDSLVLLAGLHAMKKFYPKKYEIAGITVGMGFRDMDFGPVEDFCRQNGIEYIVRPTEIGEIIFEHRKEANPCSLCSRMRRGALNEEAERLGFNKVALGHNFDDAVETFMLNLFYEGRIGCFSPLSYLDRTKLTVIRPLVLMPEKEVRGAARRLELPVVHSTCPANGNTKREYMKQTLAALDRENRGLRERIFGAMVRGDISGFGFSAAQPAESAPSAAAETEEKL